MVHDDSIVKDFSRENWKILKDIKDEKKCLEDFKDSICHVESQTERNSTIGEQTETVSELSKDPLICKWLMECDQYSIQGRRDVLRSSKEKQRATGNDCTYSMGACSSNTRLGAAFVDGTERHQRETVTTLNDDTPYRSHSFDESFRTVLLCAFSIDIFRKFFLEIKWQKVKGTHVFIEQCIVIARAKEEKTFNKHQLRSAINKCCDLALNGVSNEHTDATSNYFLKLLKTCFIDYFHQNKKLSKCLKACKQKMGSRNQHTIIDHVFCGITKIRMECLTCGISTSKRGTMTPRMIGDDDNLKYKTLIINYVDYDGHLKAVDKTRLLFSVKETTRLKNLTERLAVELSRKSRKIHSRDLVANKITTDYSIIRLNKDESLFSVICRDGELYYHHVINDSEGSLSSRSPSTSTPLHSASSDVAGTTSVATSITTRRKFSSQRLVVAVKVSKTTYDGIACLRLFFVKSVRRIMANELYDYFEERLKPRERGMINIYIRRPKVAKCRLCTNQKCSGCPLNPNRIVLLSEDDQIEVNFPITDNSVLLGFSETLNDHQSLSDNNPLVLSCIEDNLNPLSNCISTLSCDSCKTKSQCFIETIATMLPELLWLDLPTDHKPVTYPENGLTLGTSVFDLKGCVVEGKDNRLLGAVKQQRKRGWQTVNMDNNSEALSLSNGHFKMRLMIYKRREKVASQSEDNMKIPIVCKRGRSECMAQTNDEDYTEMESKSKQNRSSWSVAYREKDEGCLNKQLFRAVRKGRIKTASKLLLQGASPNATEHGLSVIHLAGGMEEPMGGFFIQLLLENGADLHLLTGNGMSVLHVAALWNRKKSVMLLIEQGALLEMKDSNGLKAIDMVEEHDHCQSSGDLCYFCKAVESTQEQYETDNTSRDLNGSNGLVDFHIGDHQMNTEESYQKKGMNENEASRKWLVWRVWLFVTRIIRPWHMNTSLHV